MKPIFNTDAEQLLLGSLLNNNSSFAKIQHILKAQDFYEPDHQDLFKEISDRYLAGSEFNPVLLKSFVNDKGLFLNVGGVNYLLKLVGYSSGVLNPLEYALEVSELSRRRTLQETLSGILEEIEKTSSQNIAEKVQEVVSSVFGRRVDSGFITEKQMVQLVQEEINPKNKRYTPTGLLALDKAMGGGLLREKLYAMPAESGRGKSTIMATMSHYLKQTGVKHLYIAAEDSVQSIALKNIASMAGISVGEFRPEHFERALEWYNQNPDTVIYTDDPSIDFTKLLAKVRLAKDKYNIEGFFLDYYQLVSGVKAESQSKALDYIAQEIKNICIREKVWCVTSAQMNRSDDIRASDGLKHSCDWLYIMRYIENEQYPEAPVEYWLEKKKNRLGKPWDIGSENNPKLRLINGTHFEEIM